ncbi:MAG TPA: 3-methyl-2-oxobutanoate hydroxymethyltransferase, partial [Thermoanaerobaculia bacterium]|nr:3-methyl-2-oxobutanoate hydroxymethyltransferase [Thermoanaerobaculia bacterium]
MASLSEASPVTVPLLVSAKGKDKIAMMTAYDAPTAALLDEAGLDVLLVGDSLAMTVYGEANTLSATMETMLRHTKAVSRSCRRALVVGDMPFLSYQTDPSEAVRNAGRFLSEAGCAAVKVEGGRRVLPAVEAILSADIPVMGHVGLTPQSVHKLGGFKVQGRDSGAAHEIREDAKALAQAGCFAIVLECVPEGLASEITQELPVPTIGIGAGPRCDGQVLVFHDVVGLTRDLRPRFVRRYADLSGVIRDA